MDNTIIISLLIIGLILWSISKNEDTENRAKGREGEKEVKMLLNKLSARKYRTLHDILLKTPNGYTQIDHIVVSTKGVFIIETKNFSGAIYGNVDTDTYWVQALGETRNSFYSPTKQNVGHERQVKRILGKGVKTIPLVCLTTKCEKHLEGSSHKVVSTRELIKAIKSRESGALTLEQVNKVHKLLLSKKVKGFTARLRHLRYVKSLQQQ